ncbi:MAG: Tol-Pal system beta propeller repeat protein TolB [Pseudomonadota bacterium]
MRFHILPCLMMLLLLAAPVRAEVSVDVNRGTIEPIPIAIPAFTGTSALATDVPAIVTANLVNSGLFKAIDKNSFIQDSASLVQSPRFAEWRAINTQALVAGTVTALPDGRQRVEFRLWDVFSQKQLVGMAYTTSDKNWRRIAHIISDDIYKRLTGEGAYFDSRIVYVAETGPLKSRTKRLAIMDQDGFNNQYLTDGADLVLTPRFSPSTQMIAYMSYKGGKPRVYIYDLNTGRQEVLGDFPGMTFAPRFSPDGKRVVMSLARNGNTDIYVMDLRSKNPQQLTTSSGIDTAPCFSPDGKNIVFESDRGGTQQLYTMRADGSDQKRITFGKGRYAGPVWSPRGDTIAFTRMNQGNFYIGVVRPDGSGERMITSAYHVEGPTWSPNGRVLSYFKDAPGNGGATAARLYTIDITGFNERPLKTPTEASDPAWSPLNP